MLPEVKLVTPVTPFAVIVQLKVVPVKLDVKLNAAELVFEQIVCDAGKFTVGKGLT